MEVISNKEYLLTFVNIESSQCGERILNEIAQQFSKTYAGLKSVLERLRIHFLLNPSSKGMKSTS
jgi:Mg-chelatase subunit ChlD